ncbi:MAG: BtrH N-terminal domain-containing protein [Bacteroidales bacterium]
MEINFEHRHAAHCENGVVRNLLNFYGIKLSEPMTLGLGSGIFFSHMPFYRLHGMALTSFRYFPGSIFTRVTQALGIEVQWHKFKDPDKAMAKLDEVLAQGIPVGLRVGVYHLAYFPKEYRMHFNAHNLCVIGKEGDEYIISDPIGMNKNRLSAENLKKVRFAQGTSPPEGRMYYIKSTEHYKPLTAEMLYKATLKTWSGRLGIPFPMFGAKGIAYLAKRMRKWEKLYGERGAAMNLAQVIRMLEEIGTGGAGFRFMYAAFLQEASEFLDKPEWNQLSMELTEVGDLWRDFSYHAARFFKKREGIILSYDDIADKLDVISARETEVFRKLENSIKRG